MKQCQQLSQLEVSAYPIKTIPQPKLTSTAWKFISILLGVCLIVILGFHRLFPKEQMLWKDRRLEEYHKIVSRVIIHYHKTGHHLSRDITKSITAFTDFHLTHGAYPRRKGSCAVNNFQDGSFFIQTAPNYFCDLNDKFPNNTRIVHMVRDTYDWIISSFLYHTQDPTPERELINFYPCKTSHWLDSMRTILGLKWDAISKVVSLCEDLNGGSRRYIHMLRTLSVSDALRLEAARLIICEADILRLPNNIIRLRESNTHVLTVEMKQWYTDGTFLEVLQFLFGNSIQREAKMEIIRNIKHKMVGATGGNHVTRGTVSEDLTIKMKAVLQNDVILGPILEEMNRIIAEELLYEAQDQI